MKKRKSIANIISITLLLLLMSVSVVLAAPIFNEEFIVEQANGTEVTVLVSGDELYRRVESIDGYTLIEDEDGWICYAMLNEDGTELISTGIEYWGYEIPELTVNNELIPKHIDISEEARRAIIEEAKSKLYPQEEIAYKDEHETSLDSFSLLVQSNYSLDSDSYIDDWLERIPLHPVPDEVRGLVVLVDFPNETSLFSVNDIYNLFNQVGYEGHSRNEINGSVRDYFYDVSGGEFELTHDVIGYYTAKEEKAYYSNRDRRNELLLQIIDELIVENYDFSTLTTNEDGEIIGFSVLYAGSRRPFSWSEGLWPHKSSVGPIEVFENIFISGYMMADMPGSLGIDTICHELGHLVLGYPDLYDTSRTSYGTGRYSLMARSSSLPPLDPYNRVIMSGWGDVVVLNDKLDGSQFELKADPTGNQDIYAWLNPNNPKEYFLLENIIKEGRYSDYPGEGLLIWHVDEGMNNNRSEYMTPENHYMVSVVQADGKFDLENNINAGEEEDFFYYGNKTEFNSFTIPDSRWWDRSISGLSIFNIGSPEEVMTFEVLDERQEAIVFKNLNLEVYIRNEANKMSGDLYPVDVEEIESLAIANWNIDSLLGIEYLTGLKRLNLTMCDLVDLAPLSKLYGLEILNLDYNFIDDLKPLSNLTNLGELSLVDNYIEDISYLKNLTALNTLDITGNSILPIEASTPNYMALMNLKSAGVEIKYQDNLDFIVVFKEDKIRESVIENPDFKEKHGSSHIYGIEVWGIDHLDISANGIKDLSGIQYLSNLRRLIATSNAIEDLEAISNLSKMFLLNLEDNNIDNIELLSNIPSLFSLNLSKNNIDDISPILEFESYKNESLRRLDLRGNPLKYDAMEVIQELQANGLIVYYSTPEYDVVSFEDPFIEEIIRDEIDKPTGDIYSHEIKDIEELIIGNRRISSLEGIENLTGLKVITIVSGNLSDISVISGLNELEEINLSLNQIEDISPLSNLINLKSLTLSSNSISDIRPISNLTNLESLSLNRNNISELSPLSDLTNLKYLSLVYNNVEDITPLETLTDLNTLILCSNVLLSIEASTPNYITLMSLKSGGVSLNYEFPVDFNDNKLKEAIIENPYFKEKYGSDNVYGIEVWEISSLNVSNMEINDLLGIEYLSNLRSLIASNNDIEDLESVANLSNIFVLDLEDNKIDDIAPLSNMPYLYSLKLNDNIIEDISPILDFEAYKNGSITVIDLSGNPLNSTAMAVIEELDANSVIVHYSIPEASVNIELETKHGNISDITTTLNPSFKIRNTGEEDIDLSNLKVRYYYTRNGSANQNFWCDHAAILSPYSAITSSINSLFVTLPESIDGADNYLEISFESNGGFLETDAVLEIQTRIAKDDWSSYDQSEDYSYSGVDSYQQWDKVTVYYNGNLIWGTEPSKN
ncbi:leucine-rich repeat domain-containing protein [Natronospora cellulosivora (SeqCode)]